MVGRRMVAACVRPMPASCRRTARHPDRWRPAWQHGPPLFTPHTQHPYAWHACTHEGTHCTCGPHPHGHGPARPARPRRALESQRTPHKHPTHPLAHTHIRTHTRPPPTHAPHAMPNHAPTCSVDGLDFNISAPHMHATALEALDVQPGEA
jgi:hypothetical protein